ncbi:MAG TPA: hypothetical protein ENK57_12960 [Polyangiaceae bacterium]|nr:hypothetical protein [Polyangiaceae bacterium]
MARSAPERQGGQAPRGPWCAAGIRRTEGARGAGKGWPSEKTAAPLPSWGFEDTAPLPEPRLGPGDVEVATGGEVPQALVLAEWVADVADELGLTEAEARALEALAQDFPSPQARARMRRALECGYRVEEVACAARLRAYWAGSGAFGVGRNRRWAAQLDWDTALAAVTSFRGVPDLDEVVHFLDCAYAEWCAGVARGRYRCDFVDFFESVARSPVTACAAGPAVVAGAGCDLLECDEDVGWWPGYGSPVTRFLADYGLVVG